MQDPLPKTDPTSAIAPAAQPAKAAPGSAEERAARKNLARLDKQLARIAVQEEKLNAAIAEHAQDYARLSELSAELTALATEREALELEWLEAAEVLEG